MGSLRVVNVTWTDLACNLHFFKYFCIASKLVCSFGKTMPGSLSVADTAVSSVNVAIVNSVKVGRPAVYSRYNSGLRTLALGYTSFD
jgi:hypothetical protein